MPARKPLSQARWEAVKGAFSGRIGATKAMASAGSRDGRAEELLQRVEAVSVGELMEALIGGRAIWGKRLQQVIQEGGHPPGKERTPESPAGFSARSRAARDAKRN